MNFERLFEDGIFIKNYICIIKKNEDLSKDENIGNHGYIGTSILWIYQRIFWKKILVSLKLLKTHENVRKTSY